MMKLEAESSRMYERKRMILQSMRVQSFIGSSPKHTYMYVCTYSLLSELSCLASLTHYVLASMTSLEIRARVPVECATCLQGLVDAPIAPACLPTYLVAL
jgi:hypothetical protein